MAPELPAFWPGGQAVQSAVGCTPTANGAGAPAFSPRDQGMRSAVDVLKPATDGVGGPAFLPQCQGA